MDKKTDWTKLLNPNRRNFLKTTAVTTAAVGAGNLIPLATGENEAQAFAYEP